MSQSPPTRIRGRLLAVDALRGVGALIVVLTHINNLTRHPDSPLRTLVGTPFEFGYLGVTLFFVLSGFCIHLRRADTMNSPRATRIDWKMFWRRRFVRLYPTYALAAALSVAAYYLTGATVRDTWRPIVSLRWDALTHALMIHNLFPDYTFGLGNAALWTIALEEQLYLVYPVFLLCRRWTSGVRTALWTLAIAIGYTVLVVAFAPERFGRPPLELGNMLIWVPRSWFVWVLGAVAAEALAGTTPLPAWTRRTSAFITAFGMGLATNQLTLGRVAASNWGDRMHLPDMHWVTMFSDVAFALAAFVLLNHVVHQETMGQRGFWSHERLQQCGRISYSLYLTHIPVINLLDTLCRFPESPVFFVLRLVLYLPVCLLVALVFFELVERHFLGPPLKVSAAPGQCLTNAL